MSSIKPLVLSLSLCLLFACQQQPTVEKTISNSDTVTTKLVVQKEKVLTKEEQEALTPDQIIQNLKDGNQRFRNNDLTARNHSALVRDAIKGQYPKAAVLACMDSRMPVEDIFDKGIGDLFVCRVAGNVVNEDILGSLEYGCKVSGAKVIIVMGHRYCGAIQSAIKNVKLGNITGLLKKVQPAIQKSSGYQGEKSYSNDGYVTAVALMNVQNIVLEIQQKSPILAEMVKAGTLKIVAAGYDLDTGEVKFL